MNDGDPQRMSSDDVRKESDRKMMEHLRGQLPTTASQNVREIDLITKPNEVQKEAYNQKLNQNLQRTENMQMQQSVGISLAGDSEVNKLGISTRSKAIGGARPRNAP